MAKIVKEQVCIEDVQIFNVYFEKQCLVQKSIDMWTKTITTLNLGLFTGLAFLLKMSDSSTVLNLNTMSYSLLLAIILLSIFGFVVCQNWFKAHQNLQDWQLRTNSVLANVESVLLKSELITVGQEATNNSMDNNSALINCGMWSMINSHEPSIGKRSGKDTMDVIARLPRVFVSIWSIIGVLALALVIIKIVNMLYASGWNAIPS